ncbi:MAG: DUF1697 domain-containing protein [Deinococcales bacterium]|jgi:uncharacterized protein (DUF1697 family)
MAEDRTKWVALLRGINVGGKRKVAMAELVALFEELGARETRTYLQSGNVVFRADAAVAGALPAAVERACESRFGFAVPALLRSAGELQAVLTGNPFHRPGADEKQLHVVFLTEEPEANAVAALDPNRSSPDAFAVRGREIYLRLPNGMARTRLTNDYFDRALATTSTVRNWRTVQAVAALVAA